MLPDNKKTNKEYWENIYYNRIADNDISLDSFCSYIEFLILEKIRRISLEEKSIIEIGAGDSSWLLHLAKHAFGRKFVGLDYSEKGCNSLKERAKNNDVAISVYNSDMFSPPQDLIESFDLVLSFGLVEHFNNLSEVMFAKKRFLKKEGKIFTLIPNMVGLNGYITKRINKEIYDIHNPHSLESFIEGHKSVGLEVEEAGYLGAVNFGVLSACFDSNRKLTYQFYLLISRLSKLIWLFEKNVFKLPATKFLSPYIYAISRCK